MQKIDRFTILSICQRRPYQERYWWQRVGSAIVGTGRPEYGLFSWRGLLVQKTGDYAIYKPWVLYADGVVDKLSHWWWGGDEATSQLDSYTAQRWLLAATADDRDTPCVPFDGIPWELHQISDRVARVAAIEAFLDAH